MRVMNWTLKRKKSISSQAASISAWCAVFDWPSIVAAFRVARHGPASSSAARRKTAARSSHGQRDQSCQASPAAAVARSTSGAPPLWTVARTCPFLCGMTASNVSPVRISSPPMTRGSSSCCACSSARRTRSSSRSGEPGAYERTGSFSAGGGRKLACVPTARSLRKRVAAAQDGHRQDEDPDQERQILDSQRDRGASVEGPLLDGEEEGQSAEGVP